MTIRKLKNIEGYYYTCSHCGAEIMHAYQVDGLRGTFGSDCVKTLCGFKKSVTDQLKIQDIRMKNFIKYGEEYAKKCNMTIEQVEASMMSGSLS